MKGYRFDVTCGCCGSALEHENGTQNAGTESLAVAQCVSCGSEWSVSVYLRPIRLTRPKVNA